MTPTQFDDALGAGRPLSVGRSTIRYHERGEGRPIVLLHGLLLNAGFWRKVVPQLADSYRCITPTLPLGSHDEPMHPDADLSPEGLADLIADLLEELELEDALVVANDTGGALAQILVTRRPQRVGGLVLTPCDAFRDFLPWQFRYLQWLARVPTSAWQTGQIMRSGALRRSPLGYGLLTKHGLPDDVSDAYIRPLRASAGVRHDFVKVLKGIDPRYTEEAARRLSRFEAPTLVAFAREDKVFKASNGRRLAEIIPRAEFALVEDSYAFVPEDRPQELAELIRAQLER